MHSFQTVSNVFLFYFFLVSGAIFEQGTEEVQAAFKFAILNHNANATARRFELQAYVDVINTADAFKLSRLSKYGMIIIIIISTRNNSTDALGLIDRPQTSTRLLRFDFFCFRGNKRFNFS